MRPQMQAQIRACAAARAESSGQTMRPVRQRSRQARTAQTIGAPWPARPRACPAPPRQTRRAPSAARAIAAQNAPAIQSAVDRFLMLGKSLLWSRGTLGTPSEPHASILRRQPPRPPVCNGSLRSIATAPLGPAILCFERLRLQLVVSARSCSVRAKHPLPREMRLGPDFAHCSG